MTLLVDSPHTFIPATSLIRTAPHVAGERRLVDSYGRRIGDLRISVTDRCNFRCVYCMPEEGMQWLKRHSIMSFDEIERIARVAARPCPEGTRRARGAPAPPARLPHPAGRVLPSTLPLPPLTTNRLLLG